MMEGTCLMLFNQGFNVVSSAIQIQKWQKTDPFCVCLTSIDYESVILIRALFNSRLNSLK